MQYFIQIQGLICAGEMIPPESLQQKTKKREIAYCRQLVIYFLRKFAPKMSWSQIGGYYGLDHSTAIHAYKTINNILETDRRKAMEIHGYEVKIVMILDSEKNVIIDMLEELKISMKRKIDNNLPITAETISYYNDLMEKALFTHS